MKKSILLVTGLLMCSMIITSFVINKNHGDDPVNGPLGNAITYKGKYMFIMTTPSQPYTVIDKAKPDDKGMNMTNEILNPVDDAITKESKGKMEKFDAVIVYGYYKNMEFIKFNNTESSVTGFPFIYENKKQGTKYVYFCMNPTAPYNVVKVFDKSALGQTGLGVQNNAGDTYVVKINAFCEKAGKISKDEAIDYDAIIVSQTIDPNSAISSGNDFGQNLQMIKFK